MNHDESILPIVKPVEVEERLWASRYKKYLFSIEFLYKFLVTLIIIMIIIRIKIIRNLFEKKGSTKMGERTMF